MDQHDGSGRTGTYLKRILTSYDETSGTNFIDVKRLPDIKSISSIVDQLLEILFPGYSGKREITRENVLYIVGDLISQVIKDLEEQVLLAYKHECPLNDCPKEECNRLAAEAVDALFDAIPGIREVLKYDVKAAFNGDPAARSEEEIVICYPGLRALAIHRVSHVLYSRRVPLIPRLMNEIAHSQTGIDIHPGATIGEGLFIDHGTGVVIGETTIIGNNVKIYQGVTLGALSFPKDSCGNIIKGKKRHPTIEDQVTIYAHATILGDLTIGAKSLIGSNVWLKDDVPANTMVYMEAPNITFRSIKG